MRIFWQELVEGLWTPLTPGMVSSFTPSSISTVLMKYSYMLKLKCNLWEDITSSISAVFVVTSSDKNTPEQTSTHTFRLMFWFAVIQVTQCRSIIRYPHPHVNHKARLNYSLLYILFMTIFSHATWKFAKAGFAGRDRVAKAFQRDGPLSSLTQAGKAVGCGVHILQTSLIIYI